MYLCTEDNKPVSSLLVVPKQLLCRIQTICLFPLVDEDLPKVPSLTITLPSNYPTFSPICDMSTYQNSTPFIEEVGRILSDKISKRMAMFSLSTLLDDWELSVLRAMSKILNSDDD